MKKPKSVLEYPIVTKKHLNYMTVSMPDLGLFEILELPGGNKINKDYVTQLVTRIARLVGISQDTLRRDIDRGILRAKKTNGGHRQIPEAQVPVYLDFLLTANLISFVLKKI